MEETMAGEEGRDDDVTAKSDSEQEEEDPSPVLTVSNLGDSGSQIEQHAGLLKGQTVLRSRLIIKGVIPTRTKNKKPFILRKPIGESYMGT